MGRVQVFTGSLIMGGGIAGTHYIAMSAMRLAAVCRFDLWVVTLSVVLAIVFSLTALLLAFDLREETRWTPQRRIGSAVVMGAAISAMHYTGMAAASFVSTAVPPDLSHAVSVSPLANNGLAIVTFLVLGAAIVTSSVDRQAEAAVRRLNEELEHRVVERTRQLTVLNEQLAESEERFRKLVEALPDAIFVVREQRIAFVNNSGVSLLGAQRPEQIVGKNISEVVHPDSLASVKRRTEDCYRTGLASAPKEHVLLRLDGSSVEIESAAIPISWNGSPAIEAIVRDITERKRAEEARRESEEQFHQIADNIHEIFWLADAATMQAIYVNPAFEQITGRPITSLQEDPLSYREIIYPDDRVRVLSRLDETLKTGRFGEEFRITRPDGTIRWVEALGFPIRDAQGNTYRLAGVVQDITDSKLAEHSLHEAQAELAHVTRALAMGELVASIAHEVNQPLTAVVTTSNFALRQLTSEKPNLQELQEAITEIVEDATRISAVISQVRALLEKGAPRRVELDINDVIQEVTMLVRNEAALSQVQVQLDLADDLPLVVGDRVQLQQVLINLAMNAIDAMRTVNDRPRKLEIKSEKHADGVLVQVQDSGIGLDPERVDRIFEPFFTTKPQGIGMGLSISRSIIESLGGRLRTVPHSQGAIFQFTLPAIGNSAAEDSAA